MINPAVILLSLKLSFKCYEQFFGFGFYVFFSLTTSKYFKITADL
jgi:hypothetical protein